MDRRLTVLKNMPLEDRQKLFAQEDAIRVSQAGDVEGRMGSYISDHPTHFNWTDPTRRLVNNIEALFPWRTYINTYWWHPPYDPPSITVRYDAVSFDVWGGGLDAYGNYTGYRGKPLPDGLHERIFNYVFYEQDLPIDWVCTNGWCWSRTYGWFVYDPYDPQGADMAHRKHLHFSMVR